jgi:hypothetical protein
MRNNKNEIIKVTRELVPTGRTKKATPHNADLIVADISGSMGSPAIAALPRIECVRQALAPFKGRAHVIAFNDSIHEVDCDAIPDPAGGTDLAKALDFVIGLEPLHVLVMCDGQPNIKQAALDSCARLAEQCIIDTLYIGPPSHDRDIAFMRELAAVGHGRAMTFDLSEKSPLLLSQGVASLLALPAPDSVVKL